METVSLGGRGSGGLRLDQDEEAHPQPEVGRGVHLQGRAIETQAGKALHIHRVSHTRHRARPHDTVGIDPNFGYMVL
jgi:hypothetical protein